MTVTTTDGRTTAAGSPSLPTASGLETARALAQVVLPVAVRGAVVRRPNAVALAQRLDADRRAVRLLQRLRRRHAPGPLLLRTPLRRFALVLEPEHVHRVLNESPEPFTIDTREKRGALAHFQPAGLLASSPEERQHRRPFNEAVLDAGVPLHRLAGPVSEAVTEEAALLVAQTKCTGALTWDDFAVGWWRAVRRVVLGDSARDDQEVTDLLLRLRKDANGSYLRPRRRGTFERFDAALREHVARAEPGSLASLVAATPAHPGTVPHQQLPQWLFAFDATGWATFRALALVASQPGAAQRARQELHQAPDLPFLRACLLESLRLWPTTPAILRETVDETQWESGTLPAGTSVVVYAPLFHRDETRFADAHRFAPELWMGERTDSDWPLVPFSGGPGMCPGRNVVLLTASVLLATLLRECDYDVSGAELAGDRPLPGTVSPFGLGFSPRPVSQPGAAAGRS